MPVLSVIVPVYKVEAYLSECIDSILAQTYTDFELILVDDGSPDRCGVICDEYAAKDDRIIVIHQENQGVSSARNAGLNVVKGQFLFILDSDDWIEKTMFESMMKAAIDHAADMVICGVNYYDDHRVFKRQLTYENGLLKNEELKLALFQVPNAIGAGCCNKLFAVHVIKDLRFSTSLALAEDWTFVFQIAKVCDTVVYHSECLYNIRERDGSATRTEDVSVIYNNILGGNLFQIILDYSRQESHAIQSAAIGHYLDDCLRYSKRIRAAGKETRQRWIIKFLKIRFMMLSELPYAYKNKLLPASKMHGYIHDLILD